MCVCLPFSAQTSCARVVRREPRLRAGCAEISHACFSLNQVNSDSKLPCPGNPQKTRLSQYRGWGCCWVMHEPGSLPSWAVGAELCPQARFLLWHLCCSWEPGCVCSASLCVGSLCFVSPHPLGHCQGMASSCDLPDTKHSILPRPGTPPFLSCFFHFF